MISKVRFKTSVAKLQERGVTWLDGPVVGVGSHQVAPIQGHGESVAPLQDQLHHRFGLRLRLQNMLRCITWT